MNVLGSGTNLKREKRKSWLKPFVVKIIAEAETSTIDYNDWII